MATYLQIDDQLVQKTVNLGGHKTKKAAVIQALVQYVEQLEQQKIISLFGQMEYDSDFFKINSAKRENEDLIPPEE